MQIELNDLTKKEIQKGVYDVYDIMDILHISKNSAYKLIRSGAFKYVIVGKMFRVPKVAFEIWLYQSVEA